MNRIFVDPGSTKIGWALFVDKKLAVSGRFQAKAKDKFVRIADIWRLFYNLMTKYKVEEVHIECINIPMTRQIAMNMKALFYSVGAIASACAIYNVTVQDDINVPAWKKYIDWNKTKTREGKREKLKPYIQKEMSEDEIAAISMGLYFVNKEK